MIRSGNQRPIFARNGGCYIWQALLLLLLLLLLPQAVIAQPCDQPTLTVTPNVDVNGEGRVDLAWDTRLNKADNCLNFVPMREEGDGTWHQIWCLGYGNTYSDVGSEEFVGPRPVSGQSYGYHIRVTAGCDPDALATSNIVSLDPYMIVTAVAIVGTGNVELDWVTIPNATGYEIERKTASGTFMPLATAMNSTYTDNSGTRGTEYAYRVRTIIGDENKSWSNTPEVTFPTSSTCTGGTAATLESVTPEANGIDLRWAGGAWGTGCSSWVILRRAESVFTQVAEITDQSTRSYRDRRARQGLTYRYKLVQPGNTAESNEKALDPYTVITAKKKIDWVELEWTPVTGRYELQRNSGDGYETLIAGTRVYFFKDRTGREGVETSYRVRVEEKAWSNVATVTYPVRRGPPDPPMDASAVGQSSSVIDVRWATPEDDGGYPISGYRIETSMDSESWRLLRSVDGRTHTISHTNLQLVETHYYRISAVNASGTSNPSEVVSGTTKTIPLRMKG